VSARGERGPGGVAIELDAPARMRDGTVLRADVYRPHGDGPWPTLLARLPYGKHEWAMMEWLDPLAAARAGFMVVVQDTRGRFASEGEWTPLAHERADGFDTVEWAARLPGSNGRVGMFGCSYLGSAQWMAAVEQPPSLAAIAPGLTWCEPLDGLHARGGALELGLMAPWSLEMAAGLLPRLALSEAERRQRLETLIDDYDALVASGYQQLPLTELAPLLRAGAPDLGGLRMQREPHVAEWTRVAGLHDRVTVPSLNVGGWHDLFIQGTLDNYAAMAALGRPARLIVGPWTHKAFADPIGELSFGMRARRLGGPSHPEGDLTGVQLAWFRRHLAPADAGADAREPDEPPVRIFVMGRNRWRDERAWPPVRARSERWFLSGDGALRPGAPRGDDRPSEFRYDPGDPVPTHGGALLMAPSFPLGPLDQARIEARPDVLLFTSAPLERELEVTGRVRVVLHAESSAPSTDWVARLCDVHPDGRSYNVCDGIARVAQGADAPGRVEVDLWSTSIAFLAGHRLRVHVTSSSFPRWDRNLNTGDQRAPRMAVARQRVHHDAERPSWIELPVIH
jgi:putative CocE/NonD family hydrolase